MEAGETKPLGGHSQLCLPSMPMSNGQVANVAKYAAASASSVGSNPDRYNGPSGLWETYSPWASANSRAVAPFEQRAKDHERLAEQLESLDTEYTRLQSDYNSLFQHYIQYQAAYSECHRELTVTQSQLEHVEQKISGFLMLVIDGNDLIFDDNLLRAGKQGGAQAAETLRRHVLMWSIEHVPDYTENVKLCVRAFLNIKDVAVSCYRAGVVGSPSTVADFLDGFCQHDTLFDIVNVNGGQDVANAKINALFNLHLHESPCLQIFLGFDKNDHHARALEYFSTDDEALRRVSLLRGAPLADETAKSPFKVVYIPGLFQQAGIPSNALVSVPSNGEQSNGSLDTTQSVKTREPIGDEVHSSPTRTPSPQQDSHTSTFRSHGRNDSGIDHAERLRQPAGRAGTGGNWSKVAGKAATLPFKDLQRAAPLTKPTGPCIMQNKAGQRVDAPMEYNHERVAKLKKMKCCNQHYIGKGCCHWIAGNGACPHRHDAKLSNDELKWLRVVARETVCKKGTHCMDTGCIYGHHCPYPKDGKLCANGPGCRFPPQMHGMDTQVAKYVVVDG